MSASIILLKQQRLVTNLQSPKQYRRHSHNKCNYSLAFLSPASQPRSTGTLHSRDPGTTPRPRVRPIRISCIRRRNSTPLPTQLCERELPHNSSLHHASRTPRHGTRRSHHRRPACSQRSKSPFKFPCSTTAAAPVPRRPPEIASTNPQSHHRPASQFATTPGTTTPRHGAPTTTHSRPPDGTAPKPPSGRNT